MAASCSNDERAMGNDCFGVLDDMGAFVSFGWQLFCPSHIVLINKRAETAALFFGLFLCKRQKRSWTTDATLGSCADCCVINTLVVE